MMEILVLLLIGLAAGTISGFMGIGGGIVVIPALVAFLGFTQKSAHGTSLALLLPPIGILAVMNYYNAGYVNIKAAVVMSLGFIAASYFASKFAVNMPEEILKKAFAVFLLLYSLKLFFGK